MTEVLTVQKEPISEAPPATKSQAILGEHQIDFIPDSESVSSGAFEFLQKINQLYEESYSLAAHSFFYFTEVEREIHDILNILNSEPVTPEKQANEPTKSRGERKLVESQQRNFGPTSEPQPIKNSDHVQYSSLFSLARHFNQAKHQKVNERRDEPRHERFSINTHPQKPTELALPRTQKEQEKERQKDKEKEKESFSQKRDEEEQSKKKHHETDKKRKIARISASRGAAPERAGRASEVIQGIENIFIRFMALMAKILGQAEAEAHELYIRIKERTDNIDFLTTLLSKINSTKGAIDWTKDEEMKKMVDHAREIGVDIPPGKYKWSEDEKKVLKENVQLRKDSMEKVTQLERTDMQRYLQEASQCHQARSNILKLLKEVMDTITHNLRP